MNTRQRLPAILVLGFGLILSACGSSLALSPTPTILPFSPTPAMTLTQGSGSTGMATPAPSPASTVTMAPVSLDIEGTYTVQGVRPDGSSYSGGLTIRLNPPTAGSSTNQAVYDLAWNDGLKGAGILIQDALDTNFLATSSGGPACAAVFYSAVYSAGSDIALSGTRLSLGTKEIGTESAYPTGPRSTLDGDYDAVWINANGGETNGTLSILQQGNIWQLAWNFGQPYTGIGISLNKSLFAAASGGEGCGVFVYKVNSDGSLHATWAEWGGNQVGEETAVK